LILPEEYNYLTSYCNSAHNVVNPVVIHYTGKSKPWQYMDRHPYKDKYYKYLDRSSWKGYRPEDATWGNFFRKNGLLPHWIDKFLSA
jgi:lipopolysaccharide biosynthesis glycosyltransferase